MSTTMDDFISMTGTIAKPFREDTPSGSNENKRNSRNLCEKRRRDLFNNLITELGALVAGKKSKLDKITILKRSIATFETSKKRQKNEQDTGHEEQLWKPTFLSDQELDYLMLHSNDKFILFIDCQGNISYASDNVRTLLGTQEFTWETQNIFDLIHPEDHSIVQNAIELCRRTAYMNNQNGTSNPVSYSCRIRISRTSDEFEWVDIKGHLKLGSKGPLTILGIASLREKKYVKDLVVKEEADLLNFGTTQSYDWTFSAADNRCRAIVGFSAIELVGTSGYEHYHLDDIEKVAAAHEEVLHSGHATTLPYRFLSKGKQWVWLESICDLSSFDGPANRTISRIASRHRMLSFKEVTDYQATVGTVEIEPEQCDACLLGAKGSANHCTCKKKPRHKSSASSTSSSRRSLSVASSGHSSQGSLGRKVHRDTEAAAVRQQLHSADSSTSSRENHPLEYPVHQTYPMGGSGYQNSCGTSMTHTGQQQPTSTTAAALQQQGSAFPMPFPTLIQASSNFPYAYTNYPQMYQSNVQPNKLTHQAEAARLARMMLNNYAAANIRADNFKSPFPRPFPLSPMSPTNTFSPINSPPFIQVQGPVHYTAMPAGPQMSMGAVRDRMASFPLAEQQLIYLLEPGAYLANRTWSS